MKEKEISEIRFSQLITSLQEAVLVENEKRQIVLANQAFSDIFTGGCPSENLIGMDCSNATDDYKHLFKYPEEFEMRVKEILKVKNKVIGEEIQLADGRYLERDYIPVYFENDYRGHMWKYRDVSAQKRIIRKLSISKKEVEDKNKELIKFARVVSNDLKAPLRGINSLAEWIMEDLSNIESKEVKYNLTLMKNRVHKMEKLIHDILEYSKIGIDQIPFECCDINEILNDVLFEYMGTTNIEIQKSSAMPHLWVKRTAIFRVFSNLLENSVLHSDKEIIKINISCKEEENYFEFKIEDNGPGIPEEHRRNVFEMFCVLDPVNKDRNSGVGLSIVERAVERHHGSIRIDESPMGGSSFVFTIGKDLGSLGYNIV